MAEIFRGKAVAAGGFEKPVAIKRILPHLSQDRRVLELRIAGAKGLSVLQHRNSVQIFDVGREKRAEEDATQGGAVRGKFAYISPEQARNEQIDPRSDVFSVGILLWELLCNRRLYSQLDDMAALRAVRDANVPRPTEMDG